MVAALPDGIALWQEEMFKSLAERTATMMNKTMIGVDLAKGVFQVHGASMNGEPNFRKKLSRQSFPKFMAEQPPLWW